MHKSVYIMNSKLPQNLTDVGGGVAVGFKQNCFARNFFDSQCNYPFQGIQQLFSVEGICT